MKDIKLVPEADNNMTSDPFVMIFWMGEKKTTHYKHALLYHLSDSKTGL